MSTDGLRLQHAHYLGVWPAAVSGQDAAPRTKRIAPRHGRARAGTVVQQVFRHRGLPTRMNAHELHACLAVVWPYMNQEMGQDDGVPWAGRPGRPQPPDHNPAEPPQRDRGRDRGAAGGRCLPYTLGGLALLMLLGVVAGIVLSHLMHQPTMPNPYSAATSAPVAAAHITAVTLQLGQALTTPPGVTVCTGDVTVNGDFVKGSSAQDLGTIAVYNGAGGSIVATFGATCFNFQQDPGQPAIDQFVAQQREQMLQSGCLSSCADVHVFGCDAAGCVPA